jgi:hypothetical protein
LLYWLLFGKLATLAATCLAAAKGKVNELEEAISQLGKERAYLDGMGMLLILIISADSHFVDRTQFAGSTRRLSQTKSLRFWDAEKLRLFKHPMIPRSTLRLH